MRRKSTPKRKRATVGYSGGIAKLDKESIVGECNRRLDEMHALYKGVSDVKLHIEDMSPRASIESVIACLLEESRLPNSKLVNEIYEALKSRPGVTLDYVSATVHSIGKRVMYGVGDPKANALEDESELSLWCWETRETELLDMKRGEIWKIRRRAREKIHKMITLLSEILLSISASPLGSHDSQNDNLVEASRKLKKMQDVKALRSFVEDLKQKNDADIAMKETEEMEINKQNSEKEKKSVDGEFCLEKCQSVKEPKLMQDEAGKGKKRSNEEEYESGKKLKRPQEEAERDQSDSNSAILEQGVSSKGPICKSKYYLVNATTSSMDSAFCQQDNMVAEDLLRSSRWGVRRLGPKNELIKEPKLKKSFSEDELPDCAPLNKGPGTSQPLHKKLLQFDNNYRPAYYGVWKKKSAVVTPRHPYQKDPGLVYDVDSDEEREEDFPGESLSDCDEDNEDDYSEEEIVKTENGYAIDDGFTVPDSEGVQVDGNPVVETKEFNAFIHKQEYLRSLTLKAANKQRPLFISNLMHEKSNLSEAKDLDRTCELEKTCLEALSMQAYPGGSVIDVPISDCPSREDEDACQSPSINNSHATNAAAIPDSYLPEIVSAINSNPSKMDGIIKALLQKFPTTPKTQLRNKVREVSDFVNNRWQIKKEVLNRLGYSTPGKVARQRGITEYFSSKRSEGASRNIPESSSPPPSSKAEDDGDADHRVQTDEHTSIS